MSSEKVIPISNQTIDCGKRVSQSKKKFIWKFQIINVPHTLQLLSSALSGKKAVHLDQVQIYSQKDVFNTNFDFSYTIQGHCFRLLRCQEGMNNFKLRIDNRDFEYLLKKKRSMQLQGKKSQQKKPSKYQKVDTDPFSQFSSFAKNTSKQNQQNDPFGKFQDFQNFDFKKVQKKSQINQIKQQSPQQDYQSSIFDTKTLNNISNSLNDDVMQGDFQTNVFGKNNNYIDFLDSRQAQSQQYGNFDPQAKKTNIDKMKLDMTGKQMLNRTKATAEELKMKATEFFENLMK